MCVIIVDETFSLKLVQPPSPSVDAVQLEARLQITLGLRQFANGQNQDGIRSAGRMAPNEPR
jgi:hypothetical protein